MSNIALTDREANIMQVLWEHGPSVVTEVQKHLNDELAYTTVQTVLRMLETKGYVSHEEEGRAHRYFPLVEEDAARDSALVHLTKKLFKGSTELMFTHLVSDQNLTPEQIKHLRKLLNKQSNKG